MATSETNCTDNFTLPVGATGAQGATGATGPAGSMGTGPATGPAGANGSYKIDVNFNHGNDPYWEVKSISYENIGYIIFPGTDNFGTPQYSSFGYTVDSTANVDVNFKIEAQVSGSTYSRVAEITTSRTAAEADGSTHYIDYAYTFSNLDTNSQVFRISAYAVNPLDNTAKVLRILAMDIK